MMYIRCGTKANYAKIIIHSSGADHTFKSKDSRIRVHKGRVCSDGPPQRLIGHAHIDNDHAVLRRRLPNTYVLVRLHGDVGERHELRIDANARKLQARADGMNQSINQ